MMKKLFFLLLIAVLLFPFLIGCEKEPDIDVTIDYDKVKDECRLAVLSCSYHNVLKTTKEKTKFIFWKADCEYLIEYDGEYKIGIDADKLNVEMKGKKGNKVIVEINMPQAILAEDPTIDRESFKEYAFRYIKDDIIQPSEKFDLTNDELSTLIREAQAEMRETIEKDKINYSYAVNLAKNKIENYIYEVGNQIGVTYEIKWKGNMNDEKAVENENG